MIVGECKIGNTIIRCDDSCVRSMEEVALIRKNLSARVMNYYIKKLEKENEDISELNYRE